MAGRPGYQEKEAEVIRTICQPAGCLYADPFVGRCLTKYSEEAVDDFNADQICFSAAIPSPEEDNGTVIPGEVNSAGVFKAYPNQPEMTIFEFQKRLVSDISPISGRPGVLQFNVNII